MEKTDDFVSIRVLSLPAPYRKRQGRMKSILVRRIREGRVSSDNFTEQYMNIVYNGEQDRAFKEVLSKLIPHLAKEDKDVIYLDADLMNTIETAKWAAKHPERAVNWTTDRKSVV